MIYHSYNTWKYLYMGCCYRNKSLHIIDNIAITYLRSREWPTAEVRAWRAPSLLLHYGYGHGRVPIVTSHEQPGG